MVRKRKSDKISKLPNALIHHIFSFIDAQYAVKTCVLSRRWIDVWKSLPFLNFSIQGYTEPRSDTLNNFVDSVLRFRDDSSSIQSLQVSLYERDYAAVNRLIDAAVNHNVQEVTIELTCLYYGFTFEISPGLLNCESLKQLTLRIYPNNGFHPLNVVLPQSISLPRLKFLCLEGILAGEVDFSKRLFASCPVLETLNMVNCGIQSDIMGNLNIESTSLEQFVYTYEHGCGYRKPKLIRLSAPNLKKFTGRSYCTPEYYLENCSESLDNLSDVSLNIEYYYGYREKKLEEKENVVRRMVKLLAVVDKVKRLELSSGFLMVLSSAADLVNYQLPCLCNLQFLRLEIWFTRASLCAMVYLLRISPNIKTLILNPDGVKFSYFQNWRQSPKRASLKSNIADNEVDWDVGLSLPGMLSHLNFVKIENMEGCDAELKILRFLLKNAKGLDEVSLYQSSKLASLPELRKQFAEKLKGLPGASSKLKWPELPEEKSEIV